VHPIAGMLGLAMMGLPDAVGACLFDLDGVLTQTSAVHARAWKQTFDAFLRGRSDAGPPFDLVRDYVRYVDGRPRNDGVRSFLQSRGIVLPEGEPDAAAGSASVDGLANRKDELFVQAITAGHIDRYEGSVRYVRAAREHHLGTAVVSSSRHCRQVLEAAHITDLFDVRVDGVVSEAQHLHGKPAPDTYLAAAHALNVPAEKSAVFEDALAGVEAGRAGRFGFVVGVDRVGQKDALLKHGADRVVDDLAELLQDA
jgi:beta-phosphoglucomutase family hydrolase